MERILYILQKPVISTVTKKYKEMYTHGLEDCQVLLSQLLFLAFLLNSNNCTWLNLLSFLL